MSGDDLLQDTRNYTNKPGWSDYVSDLYDISRETYHIWVDNGKPRQGPIHDIYLQSKRRFKYAIRFINKNENTLRRESLAKKMSNLKQGDFWKEVNSINKCNVPLPSSIENATGSDASLPRAVSLKGLEEWGWW